LYQLQDLPGGGNQMHNKSFISFLFIVLFLVVNFSTGIAGTTGKIAGVVTDAQSGEPLAGVNVFLEGTSLGAATDVDGTYFIINIPPGRYTVKVIYVGYAEVSIADVQVNTDLTTTVDVLLQSEIMTSEAIQVVAQKPIIQKDVAASQRSLTSDDIKALPVVTIEEAVGLQAGVTSGLSIRGGGSDEALFMVDGIQLRDQRNNQPMTQLPLSAIQEVSVQSGGFGAEYNNVRSGVVNVVTREGSPDRYSGTVAFRISPATPKHFGISAFDPMSFWHRPYLDPEVMWTGTRNGVWDEYTQRQYPQFDGWNNIALESIQNDDPTDDITPDAALRRFQYEHRKQGDIEIPDYTLDFGVGGPIAKSLGNLRFYLSARRTQEAYLMQLSRDALTDQVFTLKLTSDLSPTMKLSLFGIYGEIYASTLSRSGGTSYFDSVYDVANAMDRAGFTVPWRMYTNIYWAPTARYTHTISVKLSHVLSPKTFYDIFLRTTGSKYYTNTPDYRDVTPIVEVFPGYVTDERPTGFWPSNVYSVEGRLNMGGSVSTSRDFSEIRTYSIRGDLVSQIDNHNQIKTGFELLYDSYDMQFGMENFVLPEGNTTTLIEENPIRLSVYVQDKIEYEGFISTLGVIMDYTSPNGYWYNVEPFDREFFSESFDPSLEDQFKNAKTESKVTFSPRFNISHPITEFSKLYFNYGHYRQLPTSERIFRVQRDPRNKMDNFGDPANPLENTVSYELGYEHALSNQFRLHLAAYYRDIKDQSYWVNFISFDGKVNYSRVTNQQYEDIRGFEIDFSRIYGDWIIGNINYEYRVGTSGHFGTSVVYENPAEMREHLRKNPVQSKPRPIPRLKSWIDIYTPANFGPQLGNQFLLGDWHFNFITRWTAGSWFTWNPNSIPGVQYNVQWSDYFNVDLKISKVFPLGDFDIKLYADIFNVFNIKTFSGVSFEDGFDYDFYMKSLHLPEDLGNQLGYGNIPGDDNPGDYRATGAEYQPMEWTKDINNIDVPHPRVIYWDATTRQYMRYVDDDWTVVTGSEMDQILEDKAYIDMPNLTYYTFLNPRQVFFGISLTYRF
jgi:hypothetical protein